MLIADLHIKCAGKKTNIEITCFMFGVIAGNEFIDLTELLSPNRKSNTKVLHYAQKKRQ